MAIVSWQGMQARAAAIAGALAGAGASVTVVYSNARGTEETGPGTWVQVPNEDFFGRKFRRLLDQADPGAAMLLIQADADCDDWPALAARWQALRARHPDLGLWTPSIDNTPFPVELTARRQWREPGLVEVMQSDGIVLGLAPPVLARLRRMDFAQNNLGWGIDWAAVTYCVTAGLAAVCDLTVTVAHAIRRGYEGQAADAQMEAFLTQLTEEERAARAALQLALRLRSAERAGRNHLLVSARQRASREAAAAGAEPVDPDRLGAGVTALVAGSGRIRLVPRPGAGPLALEADGQRLALRPAPAAAPRPLTLEPQPGAGWTIDRAPDSAWNCPGQATVRLVFPPQAPVRRVPLCAPVELPPAAGDLTLMAGMAVHRGSGDLLVAWHDREDPGAREERYIRFEPGFSGTRVEGDYQGLRLRLPASAGTRVLSLTLCVWQSPRALREPQVFLLSRPVLLPTAEAEAPAVPLVVLGEGPAPEPGAWLEASVPAGAAAVDLCLGTERLPVLRRAHAPAMLRRAPSDSGAADPGTADSGAAASGLSVSGASAAALSAQEAGRIEVLAPRPCPALLCLDGRATRLLWLDPRPRVIALPGRPAGQGVTLRDITGTLILAGDGDGDGSGDGSGPPPGFAPPPAARRLDGAGPSG